MAERIFEIERDGEDIVLRFKKNELPHIPEDTRDHLKTSHPQPA